uniref:SH3 domain-containing protein n=2 Tax=Myzomyia TaxID=59140 RepID=A0A182MA42_9DIPT
MNEEYYEAETPLGTCRALYPFDATSEGSIPMSEGEELQVIEVDQGDGWTRVRRFSSKGWEEGFVPTSYIECTLYA